MKLKRNAAFVTAVAMLACSASCFSSKSGRVGSVEVPTEAVTVEGVDANDAVEAAAGDAYLAIADEAWEVQYLGNKDVNGSDQLSYDAGVAHISGNGEYTVSVTADTNGFRYDETGDINGDAEVDELDLLMLARYNAGYEKETQICLLRSTITYPPLSTEYTAYSYRSVSIPFK